MTRKKKPINSLLFYCLLTTVGVHLALITYLFRHPLFLEPSFSQAWTKGMKKEDVSIALTEKRKSFFIEEALNQIAIVQPEDTPFSDGASYPASSDRAPSLQDEVLLQQLFLNRDHLSAKPIATDEAFFSSLSLHFPEEKESLHLLTLSQHPIHLPHSHLSNSFAAKELLLFVEKGTKHNPSFPFNSLSQTTENKQLTLEKIEPTTKATKPCDILDLTIGCDNTLSLLHSLEKENIELQKKSATTLKKSSAFTLKQESPFLNSTHALAPIETYLPEEPALSFSDWSNYFFLDTVLLPSTEKEQYRFTVTITPKDDLSAIQMPQNFYFLIDRSNSIERHRFAGFKRAVLRALSTLSPEQTFNICIFDRKQTHFSKMNLPATKSNVQRAQNFLATQEYSGSFAATDLYGSLIKLLPKRVNPSEMHIAFLLSDGNAPLSYAKQKKALNQWLKKNNKKISLYAAAVGRDNNLHLLGILTSQTGGALFHSPTHAAFPRKLAKLVHSLRSPLAKDLVATVHATDSTADAKLVVASSHLPALFNDHPFTLFGSVKKPTRLTIAIQGVRSNEPIVIQKEIIFEAPPAHHPLIEKEWTKLQAWVHFDNYMKSGKKEELKKAEAFFEEATKHPTRRRR